MNFRDLQYFVTVAETEHFGKAAEKCFVSQPTLSGQIRKLEDELGIQLLERTNKQVSVTPVGKDVLVHARQMLELADTIRQVARQNQDVMSGPFRLGVIPTIAPYLMPLLLTDLKQIYPQMHLILSEEITEHLHEQLLGHQIDAALLATPVNENELSSIDLYDEPFWLAHHRNDPLYNKDTIDELDLAGLDLLLLSDGHCLTQQVMQVCGRLDQKDSNTSDVRAASMETLLQLVAAGYGSTLVPALAVRGAWMTDMGIIARQLDSKVASRRVLLVYRSSYPRKEAIERLAELVVQRLPNTVHRL